MLLKGTFLRMSKKEDILSVTLLQNNSPITIFLPISFQSCFTSIPTYSIISISGNFTVNSDKIYCNSNIQITMEHNKSIFTKLKDLKVDVGVCIRAVIIGWMDPIKTNGPDYVYTVEVMDDTVTERVGIKIFTKEQTELEFMVGDIVEIYNIKLISLGFCISMKNVRIVCLYRTGYLHLIDNENENKIQISNKLINGSVDDTNSNIDNKLEINSKILNDQSLMKHDCNVEWIQTLIAVYNRTKHKYCKLHFINEIQTMGFYDIVGEVIDRIIESNNLTILLLTDYTKNQLINTDKSAHGFNHNSIIFIKAWGTHAINIQEAYPGSIVSIKNAKVEVHSESLIGTLSESRISRVVILNENNPYFKTVMLNKSKFSKIKNFDIHVPERYLKFPLIDIPQLLNNEYLIGRIRCFVAYAIPNYPKLVYKCATCGIKFSRCNHNEEVRIQCLVKIILSDNVNKIAVICRNNVCQAFFKTENEKFRRNNYFECIIMKKVVGKEILNYVIDFCFM